MTVTSSKLSWPGSGLVRRAAAAMRGSGRPRPRTESSPTPRRATFHDPALQGAFERDGYVVVDLLGAAEVAQLQDRYDRLDHTEQEDWPWVEGFETSLYDPRRDYRAQILDDAEAVLSEALDQLLVSHRIMFANWVVKLPHASEVPLHADWTFLDESRFSSATVWCPLVATGLDLHNGPLGVVVGSHRRIDFVRVANFPTYDRCEAAVADLARDVPTLRPGQAIVMDNRVVHFSPPNDTDRVRVALGCVVGPVEAALHHYWLDDRERLLCFELDRSFYLSYSIGQPNLGEGILGVSETSPDAAEHAIT